MTFRELRLLRGIPCLTGLFQIRSSGYAPIKGQVIYQIFELIQGGRQSRRLSAQRGETSRGQLHFREPTVHRWEQDGLMLLHYLRQSRSDQSRTLSQRGRVAHRSPNQTEQEGQNSS